MMNMEQFRKNFELKVWDSAISRADFEKHFRKTSEKVIFTFNGWDGRSYDGESRSARVYRTDIPGWENARFVKVGTHVHCIDEEQDVKEKATGRFHKTTKWAVDVLKAE